MNHFTFQLTGQRKQVPLAMGETSGFGQFGVNSRCLEKDKKPWLPIMAEFHPTRYDCAEWELELRKMKAAGVDIVATYLFWIFHEEEEGTYCFDGNRDISRFLELCRKVGLYAFLRIGPWCHGECRNGGFPDWLQNSGIPLRCNDERYLQKVKQLFAAYAGEINPWLFRNGGPVIGIQLENELTENSPHLAELKRIALSCGMQVPYYTVTGWGVHVTEFPRGEVLPVFGCYPAAPWEQNTDPLPISENYYFKPFRNDSAIGSDLLSGKEDKKEDVLQDLPFLTCELGPGNQLTWHRRPTITTMDVLALAMVSLGSGNSMPGYYMFHGGFNPPGGLYQESKDTGYLNDLPVSSYDFQAPLDEYGQPRESYFYLKRMHQFIHCCGEKMARMTSTFPDRKPISYTDLKTPRLIFRGDEKGGYVFFNTHQRNYAMEPIGQLSFTVCYPDSGKQICGPVSIPADTCGVFALRQSWLGITVEFMTVLPLWSGIYQKHLTLVCAVQEGIDPILELQGRFTVRGDFPVNTYYKNGNTCIRPMDSSDEKKTGILHLEGEAVSAQILILNTEDSLHFYPVKREDETYFLFRNGIVWEQDGQVLCCEEGAEPLDKHFVTVEKAKNRQIGSDNRYAKYLFADPRDCPEYILHVSEKLADICYDAIVTFDIRADVVQLYAGDLLIADDYLRALPWRVSLRRILPYLKAGLELRIKCSPVTPERNIYLDEPVCAGEVSVELTQIQAVQIRTITEEHYDV